MGVTSAPLGFGAPWLSGRGPVTRPADVYVQGSDGEAVFNLHCPGGPPALRGSYGFKLADLNRIEEALAAPIVA